MHPNTGFSPNQCHEYHSQEITVLGECQDIFKFGGFSWDIKVKGHEHGSK